MELTTGLFQPVSNGHPSGMVSTTGSHDGNQKLRNAVRSLLGDQVALSNLYTLGDLDLYETGNHTTTGIPYAIHGTANVIRSNIATKLMAFADPIKAIFGTEMVRERKVIITRKYVVGGATSITPERSSARTVSLREDRREVTLTRYGADISMNLNLFLRPEDAREELQMKLDHQREHLEQTLVDLGYEAIFNQGTHLMSALMRSSASAAGLSQNDRQKLAERIYMTSVFATMAKNSYPVENMLAACAKANVYTPPGRDTSAYSVLITPPGMMHLQKYTKMEDMVFNVSGVGKDRRERLEMPMPNVATDHVSRLRVLVHQPAPSYSNGTANPQVEASGLSRVVGIATYYPFPKDAESIRIVNFKERCWHEISKSFVEGMLAAYGYKFSDEDDSEISIESLEIAEQNGYELVVVRPKMQLLMSSAILCTKPGNDTGSLLMAYPSTGVSTSQATESMKIQLRAYMGAVVKRPDNIVVIPDVQCEGLVGGHGCTFAKDENFDLDGGDDLVVALKRKGTSVIEVMKDDGFIVTCGRTYYRSIIQQKMDMLNGETLDGANEGDFEDGVPLRIYQGRTEVKFDNDKSWNQWCDNLGHLGPLDRPDCDRLEGIQKYSSDPNPMA